MERFLNREEIRELLKKELEDRPLIDCVKERLDAVARARYTALDFSTMAKSYTEILDLINIYESNVDEESNECNSHEED